MTTPRLVMVIASDDIEALSEEAEGTLCLFNGVQRGVPATPFLYTDISNGIPFSQTYLAIALSHHPL